MSGVLTRWWVGPYTSPIVIDPDFSFYFFVVSTSSLVFEGTTTCWTGRSTRASRRCAWCARSATRTSSSSHAATSASAASTRSRSESGRATRAAPSPARSARTRSSACSPCTARDCENSKGGGRGASEAEEGMEMETGVRGERREEVFFLTRLALEFKEDLGKYSRGGKIPRAQSHPESPRIPSHIPNQAKPHKKDSVPSLTRKPCVARVARGT